MLTVADTAYAIAAVRAREAERPEAERLFTDPYAHLFEAAGEHAREGVERFLALPFFADAIRLRTRHIDDVVRASLRQGARQLVLMGVGFDTRALRLEEVATFEARSFEIDLPAQIESKQRLLRDHGIPIPSRASFLACDFGTAFEVELHERLRGHGLDPAQPAVFVWEGVVGYLGQEAAERTMAFMASAAGPGSRVIFDFSDFAYGDGWGARLAQRAGFTGFEAVRFDELWRRHMPGDPPPSAAIVSMGLASR